MKEKLRQKAEKESELKRHQKLQKEKINRQIKGYHNLKLEIEELKKEEVQARKKRLDAQ